MVLKPKVGTSLLVMMPLSDQGRKYCGS